VITTECFLDGYAIRDKSIPIDQWRALGERIPGGAYLERLQNLADELNIYLVAGMLEGEGLTTYNSAVLIDPDGKLVGRYRKQHMGHELVRNTPGQDSPVFDTPFGKVGLMICADRRYPETIRKLGEAGAELMLCPSGGMWGPKKNDHHLQARSRENDVPIVFVHPIEFLVTGPDGTILDRRFAGDVMDVPVDGIGGAADKHLVAIMDLPLEQR
jgi:predicted amidohydrolase